MKVKELIELLQKQDSEREVIMSKDAEGNHFSPFSGLTRQTYEANSTWDGEIGLEELTPKLIKRGFTDEDPIYDQKVIVLWPVN